MRNAYRTSNRQDRVYAPLAHQAGSAATDPGAEPACRDHDPELWFPISETGPSSQHAIREAKAICATCPLSGGCLAFSVREGIQDGIWGGMTTGERRHLSRESREAMIDA